MSVIRKKGKEIQQFTFEIRYEPAYLLWDTAGTIWAEIQKKHKLTPPDNVAPNSVKFTIDNEFEVAIEINRAYVIWVKNKKTTKEFYALSDLLVNVCKEYLELKAYSRVGARFIYLEKAKDLQEATDKYTAYGIAPGKTGNFFKIDGAIKSPEFACKWEDEDIGLTIRCRVFEQKLGLELPLALSIHFGEMKKEIFGIQYDVDYFTKKNVKSSLLQTDEWIKQAQELVEQDIDRFLET